MICRGWKVLSIVTSATSFWTSAIAGQSVTSCWTSSIAAHFISGWQTLVGSRGPASSQTESMGSPIWHKISIANMRHQRANYNCVATLHCDTIKKRRLLIHKRFFMHLNCRAMNLYTASPSPGACGNSPLEMNLFNFLRIFLWDLEGWNFSAWHLERQHKNEKVMVKKNDICA